MKTRAVREIQKGLSLALVAGLLFAGCAPYYANGHLAAETFGRGLVNLILSPLMIVSGIAQGIAFLPYTIGTGLAELNRALLEAQAVTLDDAYRATYGVSIQDPRVDPRTGQVAGEDMGFGRYRPDAILDATRRFQKLLVSQGMPADRARQYVIGAVYTHTRSRGHILLTVMYRHPGMQPVRVVSKHTGIATTFHPEQVGWYDPYERDVAGQIVDEVIDWTGIEYHLLKQDKLVATLMVLAAESVKSGKRSHDYWQAERRWIAGDSAEIIRESMARVRIEGLPRG